MRVHFGAAVLAFTLFIALSGTSNRALALEPPADGMELLARVKTLADQGQLFDPAVVARAFPGDGSKVAFEPEQVAVCRPGAPKGPRITRWIFAPWFRNVPNGRPHLPYRAMGPFGHDGITGDPTGFYVLIDHDDCSDPLHTSDRRSALLLFDNLPGFSCLTMAEISSVMPIKDLHAMDGARIYAYPPPARDEHGARVTFSFDSYECVAGISVEQKQEWGAR
jgi:hypothetical protein